LESSNPKDLISAQSKLRREVTSLNEEWKTLEGLHRAEAKKKRSKYPSDEMARRKANTQELFQKIKSLEEMQRASYVKGYSAPEGYQPVRFAAMEDSEAFRKPKEGEYRPSGVTGSRNNDMTGSTAR